jgi:hypothetical protein
MAGVGLAVCLAASSAAIVARQGAGGVSRQGAAPIALDNDDVAGVVTSANGPEAGVWVIAETRQLPTPFRKIVVTDDQGRYLVPDLPKATYEVFVRGYGMSDSPRVKATPGERVDLRAVIAASAREAAQYYPPNYWWAMLEVPPPSDFPGTGPNGNGISPTMTSQRQWIGALAGCFACHQLGDRATREIPASLGKFGTSFDAWDRRVQSGQVAQFMISAIARFGRKRYLGTLASWTDRIAAGEVPPVAPPRPQGLERNVVITLWDWSDEHAFNHDTISTDKRHPTVNPYGAVYNTARFNAPDVNVLDPVTNEVRGLAAPIRDPDTPYTTPSSVMAPSPYWGSEIIWHGQASLHNPMMDERGRVWVTHAFRKKQPAFCTDGSIPSSKLYPLADSRNNEDGQTRQLSFYDPKTKQWTLIDTCFGTHHLQFAEDANNTLWTSGGGEVVGWLNTKLFEQTHDAAKAQMWTPFVLDTNGNGKRDEGYVGMDDPVDPTKDKRIRGGSYGVIPNPVDGSAWTATAGNPGAIIRLSPGANPPATTLSEVYVPPEPGAVPRGIDVDRNGIIWTALAGSGHIASFDRSKCKVLNGPTATGRHCPEGWTLYQVPGPRYKGAPEDVTTNMLYYNWVDQFNTFGLGENMVVATGTGSESLVVLDPKTKKFYNLRVPYPMGFYHRGVDGRIDDPKAGWKGRGLWANYGMYTPWHYEGGKGTTSKAVHFQLRPDPLAK